MRGMMVTVQGEDYVNYAEARGLKSREIFFRYALRNALLPQTTALALAMGYVVSGAVLVEGWCLRTRVVGTVLYRAVQTFDYFVIYGVVLMGHPRHRCGDVDSRFGVSAPRSAHCLPPMTLSPDLPRRRAAIPSLRPA